MFSDQMGPALGQRGVLNVGLTGNIGSGKSTVARLLEEKGAAVIDSDALAREATDDPEVLRRIGEELGQEYVVSGRLDRERMGRRVFSDSEARRRLEGIVHPWVRARSRSLQEELLGSQDPPSVIVHDIPLLFESRLEGGFDRVVVVTAPADLRAARASARTGLSEAEFGQRDASQLPLELKAERADHVVDNSGDLDHLRSQVAALWRELTAS